MKWNREITINCPSFSTLGKSSLGSAVEEEREEPFAETAVAADDTLNGDSSRHLDLLLYML